MSPETLYFYTRRAFLFALAVSVVYGVLRLLVLRIKKRVWNRRDALILLLVFYLAALLQITVIRSGPDWQALQSGNVWRQVILTPLQSARELYEDGLWYVCVEVIGNIGGFVLMGILPPLCFPRFARLRWILATSAGVSLFIELMQFLLATGVTDVDDVLFNTLGGLCGYGLLRLIQSRAHSKRTATDF